MIDKLIVINKEEFEAKFGHLLIGVNLDKYSKPLKGFIEDAFEAGKNEKTGWGKEVSNLMELYNDNPLKVPFEKFTVEDYLKQEIEW